MNDLWLFDLMTKTWLEIEISGLKKTAFHCVTSVYESGRKGINIGKKLIGEVNDKRIMMEGVYMFGGKDEDRVWNEL
jgi:hypothetical protein